MRIKTIIILLMIITLATFVIQNTGSMTCKFWWFTFSISKMEMLLLVTLFGFVLGYLVGRPKKVKTLGQNNDTGFYETKPGTLSDEDKDYLS